MSTTRAVGLGMVVISLALLPTGMSACQMGGGAVAIDQDDLGGVVTSGKGPEGGVWVIAETTDLPTKFVRIVVTDDEGRYLVPDLPQATYRCMGARLRSGGLAQGPDYPRHGPGPERHGSSQPSGGGSILPGQLLVLPAPSSRQERIPRHRPLGQRDFRKHKEPGPVDQTRQDRRLPDLPSDGEQGHPRAARQSD